MALTLRSRIAVLVGLAALAGAAIAVAAETVAPGAGVAVIVVSPVLGYFAGRAIAARLLGPLDRLGGSATAMASGSTGARASTKGPREVRLVAESFNKMSDDVENALSQLSAEETRKTQFVSDVSHELRTPLTAIRGAAETLLDGDVAVEDQQRFLSTIASEAERLTRLANDLLTLQRIEGATGELPLRRIDLRDAAERAAAMLEPLIEDRGVTLSIVGKAPTVLGDRDRIQQVVANLVDNASRLVGEGGVVTVELSAEEGQAVFSVTDDGPGIPAEDLEKLFDRFYRADTSRTRTSGGAGLGLAIVKAIVTAHGGTIEAAPNEPRGSRFTVRLPGLPSDDS